MAEAIGIASGLVALTTFALKCSLTLHETIKSFQNQPRHVLELMEELEALSDVLSSLRETSHAVIDTDLSALKPPLERCGRACADFQQELLKCTSRSGNNRNSFRDWFSMRYMGDDIRGFRESLARYKSTIIIALQDVTL